MDKLILLRFDGVQRPYMARLGTLTLLLRRQLSYGVLWDLAIPEHIGAVDQLLQHLGSSCGCFRGVPSGVSPVGHFSLPFRGEAKRAFAIALSRVWEDHAWKEGFGTLLEPRFAWALVRVDSCQYDEGPSSKPREDPIIEQFWVE